MLITEFTITEEHIVLLRNLHTTWQWGTLNINNKRPFGDSDFDADIARLLGWEIPDFDNDNPNKILSFEKRCDQMFKELSIALQICLSVGDFKPGRYYRPDEYDTQFWLPYENFDFTKILGHIRLFKDNFKDGS